MFDCYTHFFSETCREDCTGDATGPTCVVEGEKIHVMPYGQCMVRKKNCLAAARPTKKQQVQTITCPGKK